jgi:hypothetical protein
MGSGKGDDKVGENADAPGFIRSIKDVLLAMGPTTFVLVVALSLIALFAPEIMGAILKR